MLHALPAHQIELEMQNDELRRTQARLEASRQRYFDLYDLAPVGYLTITEAGVIVEANLAAARLLGVPRSALANRPLSPIVLPEDQDIYCLHQKRLFEAGSLQVYELRLLRQDGSHFWARIDATVVREPDGVRLCRVVVSDMDERKRAEEALRASEARYRDLVENASDLICTHDLNGVLLSVNAAAARILGYATEEIVGRSLRDLVPGDRQNELSAYLEAIERDEVAAGILKVVVRPGEVRYWEYRNSLRTGEVGTPVVRGVARDVTEQVLAKRALKRSEEKHRTILETIEESYYEVDLAGNLTFFNDSLSRLLGYSRDELIGMNNRQYTDAENADKLYQAFNTVYTTGEPTRGLDWEIVRKDGSKRIIEASVSLRKDSAGKRLGFRGIIRDITEHKRAEEALRESQEMLRESQRIAGLGSYVLDIPTGLWARTDVLDSVFGVDEGYERSVEGWAALVHPDDRSMMVDYFTTEVVGKGQVFDKEYRIIRHRDQAVRWVHGLGRLEFDAQERPLRMRGTIQDITERKLAEEALAHSRAQLVQAQKLEAVGRLAGGVAHDFNNILQVLLSLATVLRLKAGSSDLAKIVGEIEAHVKRGAGLTQQLLLFSRRQMVERKRVDLGELVGTAGVLLRRLIPENVRLTVDTTPERQWVEGDAGQLQQVLVNLAVNAKDAMPEGGTLTIRTSAGAGEAVVEVIDTGHGIDEATRSHLFEPFFTTKDAGKGTGLGLSVVHGIVEQHGGRVEVESVPGEGSRFRVILPVMPAPDEATGEPSAEGETPRGRGERVLIVEDEDGARKGLTELLTMLGYEVVALGCGEEASVLPDLPTPNLLLTDLMLPGIDGARLAAGLRDRWPDLKVVLMSGYTEDEAVRRGVEGGSVHFLQKPFDVNALAQAVRAALAGAGREAGAR